MYVFLKNGKSFHVTDADRWKLEGPFLVCMGLRDKEIMRFTVDAVAGWCYDSEDITTFGINDQCEAVQ